MPPFFSLKDLILYEMQKFLVCFLKITTSLMLLVTSYVLTSLEPLRNMPWSLSLTEEMWDSCPLLIVFLISQRSMDDSLSLSPSFWSPISL